MGKDNLKNVKEFYKDKFAIDGKIVDIASVLDVLRMSVSGMSNTKIANITGIKKSSIEQDIKTHINKFSGWEFDLEVNPLHALEKVSRRRKVPSLYEAFYEEIMAKTTRYKKSEIRLMYRVCDSFIRLKETVDRNWK